MKIRNFFVLGSVALSFVFLPTLPSFGDHDHEAGPSWVAQLTELKQNLNGVLQDFRFEEDKISKIIQLADWAVRNTAMDYRRAHRVFSEFKNSLRRGFSYDFRNKWVSETPKISLEEKVNSMVKSVIDAVLKDGGALPPEVGLPPEGGAYLSVYGSFTFYRYGSWPPVYPGGLDSTSHAYPYPPYPSPTRRGFSLSGPGVQNIYFQCLNYIREHELHYIVAVRANRAVMDGVDHHHVISAESACRFIARHAE